VGLQSIRNLNSCLYDPIGTDFGELSRVMVGPMPAKSQSFCFDQTGRFFGRRRRTFETNENVWLLTERIK